VIAGGRLTKLHEVSEAEYAVIVADEYQHQGLGTELCRLLLAITKHRRHTSGEPQDARNLQSSRLHLRFDLEERLVRGEITLTSESQ
jgi:acetyltransferase (GNAT) family protein